MSDAVLIFDGDCSFCTSTANYFTKRTGGIVKAEAWQLADLSKYGLTSEQAMKRVYLITKLKQYEANWAFAKLLTLQSNLGYRLIGFLLFIPPISWLAIPGYYLVARFRHRLPGGTPACKL